MSWDGTNKFVLYIGLQSCAMVRGQGDWGNEVNCLSGDVNDLIASVL